MANTRVAIIDDLGMVRRGTRLLLEAEPELRVVGEAEDAERGFNLVQELAPDVVVMEVKGRTLDGLSLCRRLRQQFPRLGIVFLTNCDSPFYFFEALRSGCNAYVPKAALPGEVLSAIRSAAQLQCYIHPSLGKWLVQDFITRSARPGNRNSRELSPRDLQVLELVSQGLTNQQIAQRLLVSINTVRRHRARLMRKVGVHHVGELIRFALDQGLVKV